MFGLMRANKCGMSEEEKHLRRLNYCGTCKTIGSVYGQKSRLLLNNDAVFLAEILTALSDENSSDWQKSYQSYNCLNLPKDEMPIALQFAAAANIILTQIKIDDHIVDEGRRRYVFARKAFSNEFLKAENLLKQWGFPLDRIKKILQTQPEREWKSASLEDVAEPTARTTAEFFAGGAELIGKGDLTNSLYEIGFAFGKLIYILDAFEDYEKDYRENQFNALRAFFCLNESRMSVATKRKVAAALRETAGEIIANIRELPIAENQKTLFSSRLEVNLQRKLKTTELTVLKTKKICQSRQQKQTFSQKWQNASQTARNIARKYSWQMPLVFLFVFAFALIAPAQSREAKSARECFDLSFNLMFLGSILGSFAAAPIATIQNFSTNSKKRRGWCENYCDCDCCCCCCECEGCCCCDGCD
jgi:hypothetical protein